MMNIMEYPNIEKRTEYIFEDILFTVKIQETMRTKTKNMIICKRLLYR